jgi:osmoprotectant transport system permease protein
VPRLFDWVGVSNNLSDEIIPPVIGHVYLSFVSVAIALLISLPTGVFVSRYRKAYPPVTLSPGSSSLSRALRPSRCSSPSLASGLGPRAVIIALVAYSLLVLIRNVVAGMDSVPEETKDAARGMGLTARQVLFKVELPLALPVIVAGVRIATVTIIGIATIGAYISGGGLGELIFTGISRNFPTRVIVGAVLATLLAIVADLLLLAVERYLRPWRGRGGRRAWEAYSRSSDARTS